MKTLQQLNENLKNAQHAYEVKLYDCDENTDFADELAEIEKAKQEIEYFLS